MTEVGDNALEYSTRPPFRRKAPKAMKDVLPEPPAVPAEPDDDEPWDERADRERREMYAELAPRRRVASRIPERWHGAEWHDLEMDDRADAIRAARAWADGKGDRGLLLWGEVGRGKTRIAGTAAWHRCLVGPVRWRNVAELLMALSYSFEHPERERALAALRPSSNAALVLDDLDKTKATDHALQPLYLAINSWVEAKAPLVVTMNRSVDRLAEDFGERFGSAIGSRLAGYCSEFEIGGVDRRLE